MSEPTTSPRGDQRRSPRCAIDFFVEETVGERAYLHPAIDLSADGIYILMHDDRRAVDGERELELEFTLPSGPQVRARGRVVHVDDHMGQRGIRIAFQGMEAATRASIIAFVQSALDGGAPAAA